MACACKVNQQIGYLQKKYGNNIPQNKKTHIAMTPLEFLMNSMTLLLVVVFMPFMFLSVFFKAFSKNKNIRISDTFLGLKYARRTK